MVSRTVLICDDAIFMRTMVGDILQQAGFEIVGKRRRACRRWRSTACFDPTW